MHFEAMQVPQSWPSGRFDLIVFSEVLYFFNRNDLASCVAHTRQSALPNATIILVNWLGETGDPSTGEEAAETFGPDKPAFHRNGGTVTQRFCEGWLAPGRSVGQVNGLSYGSRPDARFRL